MVPSESSTSQFWLQRLTALVLGMFVIATLVPIIGTIAGLSPSNYLVVYCFNCHCVFGIIPAGFDVDSASQSSCPSLITGGSQ